MGRKRTGTIDRRGDVLGLRVPVTALVEGKEKTVRLWVEAPDQSMSDEEARDEARALTEHFAGRVIDPTQVYDALKGKRVETVERFVREIYLPSRSQQKSHRYQVSAWNTHILPILGRLNVHTFDADHLRALVQKLDALAEDETTKFSPKNAVNLWGLVTKLCHDLVSSKNPRIRIRKDNPCLQVTGPDRGDTKQLQWLYPNELQKLLECETVPVLRRRRYALYVYLFCRAGELPALDFEHNIDLEHGMVTIDRKMNLRTQKLDLFTKADGKSAMARSFPIEEILVPLLRALLKEGGSGRILDMHDDGADQLRGDLWTAGVRRSALHEKAGKHALVMRLHDLRATGITYLAIRGHTDNEIRDRAGHTDFKMTSVYIRRGRMSSKLIGAPFQPLPESLLEQDSRQRKPKSSRKTSMGNNENPESVKNSGPSGVRRKGLEPFDHVGKGQKPLVSSEFNNPIAPSGDTSSKAIDDILDDKTVSGPFGPSCVDGYALGGAS